MWTMCWLVRLNEVDDVDAAGLLVDHVEVLENDVDVEDVDVEDVLVDEVELENLRVDEALADEVEVEVLVAQLLLVVDKVTCSFMWLR